LIGSCVDDIALLAEAFRIVLPAAAEAGPLKLGVSREIPPVPLESSVAAAFDRAIERLGAAFSIEGCPIADLFEDMFPVFAGTVLAEAGILHFGRNDLRTIMTRYTPETRERLEHARTVSVGDYAEWQEARKRFVEKLTTYMSDVDFLVLPTCPSLAPEIGEDRVTIDIWSGSVREALMTYTAPFKLAGFPAISVPLEITPDGLPCAVQIVARRGRDGALLSFARRVEATIGGQGTLYHQDSHDELRRTRMDQP
jgi:aspartyl-tRNA(Asn)/glutamyl-tRNA(Gln) amidotransferase subunit A